MRTYYSKKAATSVIIANMIGTGVFTSIGFQLMDIQSTFLLVLLWTVGGIAALCGAATYAELGSALPRSGGEYNFLGRIYHPLAGFISGWISTVIGFAAPIAAVALAFSDYSTAIIFGSQPIWIKKIIACLLVLIITLIHVKNKNISGKFQIGFTSIKVFLIIGFCLCAFTITPEPQPISFLPQKDDFKILTSTAFGISLIYVSYAYTGWNAAVYITSELERPQKELPKILLIGTATVMVLYLLLNIAFLYSSPIADLEGKTEIGYIAAVNIFGSNGAAIVGLMLSLLLISTVSAMIIAGPRALQAIGEDFNSLSFLSKVNKSDIPENAIYFQSIISLIYIFTSSFEKIIIFAGMILALNSFLAILGVFVLRRKEPDLIRPYKTFGYPFVPAFYLIITFIMIAMAAANAPLSALGSITIIIVGVIFYRHFENSK
jgi:APA family basic amino acid/polyamine antiporter